MWSANVAQQPLALQGSPRRQLCRWDPPAFPVDLGLPADADDTDPLVGSEWREQIQLVRRLSAGAYGFVWCCLDRDSGSHIAIKFIARDKNTIDKNVEREIINHSMLMHPHIVEFKICFLTAKYLAIAMEYAEGQDLLRQVLSSACKFSLVCGVVPLTDVARGQSGWSTHSKVCWKTRPGGCSNS